MAKKKEPEPDLESRIPLLFKDHIDELKDIAYESDMNIKRYKFCGLKLVKYIRKTDEPETKLQFLKKLYRTKINQSVKRALNLDRQTEEAQKKEDSHYPYKFRAGVTILPHYQKAIQSIRTYAQHHWNYKPISNDIDDLDYNAILGMNLK